MSFKAYHLSSEGELRRDLDEKEVRTAFESRQGLLWVDICETTEEDGRLLERVFGFHHLAVEDCVSPNVHPPKVDDFRDYLFIIVHGVNYAVESNMVETTELAIFLGPHFVVTNHNFPLYSVESVMRLVEDDGRPMRRGADFLVHAFIDAMVDNVLPTIDNMGERAEGIEEVVIRNPQESTLEAILQLKRSALRLHRVMAPQREVLNRMSRGEFSIITQDAQMFYRDIYDHMVRIEDLNQSLRDRASDALSTYLSSVANRQNETMRILSIVAAIFLPLSLVAGVYGMNFENMPELGVSWAYFAVLGFMAFIAVNAIWWAWARKWIAARRWKVAGIEPLMAEPHRLIGYVGQIGHLHK